MKDRACRAKVVELEPAAIVTEEGRVKRLVLAESIAVTPPTGAFLVSIKVQVPEAEGESTAGLQASEEMAVDESRPMVAVAELPL